MKVEELQVLISANADQFHAELQGIRSQLSGLGKTTDGVSQKIGGSFTGAIIKGNIASQVILGTAKKLATGFANLTKSVAQNGGAYSRLKIATETVARNMGMSASEVDRLRDSLIDTNTYGTRAEEVIKTLAMSGLVDMAESLKAVDARTGETVQGVEALVLTMKDLSATAGVDSATGIERLTKFVRRGEATFADGIIEIGEINREYKAFADTVGKTTDTLLEEERARVRLNVVMREGQKSFGAYANTFQSSSKAWESVRNVLRTLAEILGSYIEPALSVVANAFFQFFNGLRGGLIASEGGIKSWAIKVAGYLVAVVRTIGAMLLRIPYVGKYFKGMADFSVKPIKNVGGALEDAQDSMGGASNSAKKLKKDLQSLAGFDELNVLSQDSGSSDAGAGAVGGGIGAGLEDIDWGSIEDNSKAINEIADKFSEKFKGLGETLKGIGEIFNNLKIGFAQIWQDSGFAGVFEQIKNTFISLLPELQTIFLNYAVAYGTMWNQLVEVGREKIPLILKDVGGLLQSIWRDYFDPYIKIMVKIWSDFSTILRDTWNKYGKDIITGVFDFVGNIVKLFQSIWDNVLNPIIKPFLETVSRLWDTHLKGTVQTVVDFVYKLVSSALEIYNKFISPIVLWLLKTLKPAFQEMGKTISSVFEFVVGVVSAVVKTVFGILGGLVDFITGVLTGNWKKAWQGVVNIFKSLFEGIGSIVKSVINLVIDSLNGFIRGLNRIKLPEWTGLGNTGFAIKEIPRLATGGVIDQPTLAWIGERGKEAVMPLEQNTGWIDELADKLNSRGGGDGTQLVVKIGENKIFDQFIEFLNDKQMATNTNLINI